MVGVCKRSQEIIDCMSSKSLAGYWRRSLRHVSYIVSIAVATTLLFSGVLHASQPYYFIYTVSSYHILPPFAAGIVGLLLPYVQITVAVCIGLGFADSVALRIGALLFMVYTCAQLSVLLRGIDVECGCFGFASSRISATSVSLPFLFFAACLFLLYSRRRTSLTSPSCLD